MSPIGPVWIAPGADPGADILTDLGSRLDPSWFVLALLVPAAVIVFWFGGRLLRRDLGVAAMEPKGRGFAEWSAAGDPEWTAAMARLRQGDAARIAEANGGTVRFEATIVGVEGGLGGPDGRQCVWRNRAGGRPDSAVASELVVLADPSGRCGLENLDRARVVAPTEKHSVHHHSVSLYVGDRVEVIGTFDPERIGEDPDPSRIVYGTLGSSGPIQIHVVDRPGEQGHTTAQNENSDGEQDQQHDA